MSEDESNGLAHMVATAASNWWLARAGADGFDLDDCEDELSLAVNEYQSNKVSRAITRLPMRYSVVEYDLGVTGPAENGA